MDRLLAGTGGTTPGRMRTAARLALLALLALPLVPPAAGAFTLGPASRRLPPSNENQGYLAAGIDHSSPSFKSSAAGFADQTQIRWRYWGEAGFVPPESRFEYFARLGATRLRIPDAYDFGDRSDLSGGALFAAVGTRVRLLGEEPSFTETEPWEDRYRRLRVTAVLLAAYDGEVESSQRILGGGAVTGATLRAGEMKSVAAAFLFEKPFSPKWQAYAAPVAVYSVMKETGSFPGAGVKESSTYTTKIPFGGVAGFRVVNPLSKDFSSGLGVTIGFEAGWVGGPAASAYISQVY
jgi:hypothetical protein